MTCPNIILRIDLQGVCSSNELILFDFFIWCQSFRLPYLHLLRIAGCGDDERIRKLEQLLFKFLELGIQAGFLLYLLIVLRLGRSRDLIVICVVSKDLLLFLCTKIKNIKDDLLEKRSGQK